MLSPDDAAVHVTEVVVRYRHKGKPWRLVFDLDAQDPVQSIYFDKEEMLLARAAIPGQAMRQPPAGKPWTWPDQGVRNEPDVSGVSEVSDISQVPDISDAGAVSDPSPVGHMYMMEAVTGGDAGGGDAYAEVTPCWHHSSCLWSCMRGS